MLHTIRVFGYNCNRTKQKMYTKLGFKMAEKVIYKIVPMDDWQQSLSQETLPLSEIDQKDGFIHFSTKAQVHKTLNKFFDGQTGLFLLEIDTEALPAETTAQLKWEKNTPEGDTYPHLYGDLPMQNVGNVYPIYPLPEGGFDIPELD